MARKNITDEERAALLGKRVADMIRIHNITNRCKEVNYRALANKLKISERTVRRHVKTLEEAYAQLGTSILDQ